jgi:hypothetical protein
MAQLIAIAAGLVIGFAVGRWWILLLAIGFAVWIGVVTDVDEVPPWLLAAGYGAVSAAGLALGVLARRHVRRSR